MPKIITNFHTHQIGEGINNDEMLYGDQLARDEINRHVDRLDAIESGTPYVTCSTPGGTAAKVVAIQDFTLKAHWPIVIYFTYGFTTTQPTLKINDEEAKPIWLYGAPITPHKVHDHTVLSMVYDGTRYNVTSILYMGESMVSGAVDLDLPSGLLWADHNVGAATPEAAGLYFSWGNVIGHAEGSGYNFDQTTYNSTPGAALDADIAVGDTYDMARHNMGSPWRLPTKEEFQELYDNCDCIWIEENGMPGRRFTSRLNGNSIFFPAAGDYSGTTLYLRGTLGFYWASSLYSATNGYNLDFNSSDVNPQNHYNRFLGFSVRAVQ